MGRISPKAHLSILIFVLIADLAALPFLHWQLIRLGSKSKIFRRAQTWTMILKCALDSALVSLLALRSSKGVDVGEQLSLAVELLLRCSLTCVSSSELLSTRRIFPGVNLRHLGWWWCKLGPIAIFSLTLLKFLPFIGLHKETLHFWTVFSASFLEFLLFSSIYWWTLISSKDHRKWLSGLAGSSILCSAVVLVTVISLVTGRKLPWIRSLLLEILLLLISIQFSLRCVYTENTLTAHALTKSRDRLPDEASNEPVRILNGAAGYRRTSTSTSRKPLSRDTDQSVELYAFSISQVQAVAKEQGILIGTTVHTHPSGCTMEGVDNNSAHFPPQRSSHLDSPQRSSFSQTSLPTGWLPEMTDFAQGLIDNGEEPTSIHILLETQWPELVGGVELDWLEHWVREGKPKGSTGNFTRMRGHQENAADLGRGKCKARTRGGNDQIARSVGDLDATSSEWDLGTLRDLCNDHNQKRAENTRRQLEQGVISRVEAEWCCRCKMTTDFVEEKCIQLYCEHRRCHYCRDFNN